MKTRTYLISLLALAVLFFSVYETYAFGGPGERRFEGKRLNWVLAKAGVPLTDEQKTQIQALFKESRDQSQVERTNLKMARRALRELILTGNATEADLQAKLVEMTPWINQLAFRRVQTFNKIAALLTGEQRAALQAQAGSTGPESQ